MFVRAKVEEHALARELRAAGRPYRVIASELNVSVNSAYRWTRDIELTPEQKKQNLRGPTGPLNPDLVRRQIAGRVAAARVRRAVCQAEDRAAARQGDFLHQAGSMLYWAEGAKARCAIEFTNSDARMVRLFRAFLTDSLGIDVRAILFSLNVYTNNGLSISEIERYWLDFLDLPTSSVRRHTLNRRPTSSSGRSRRKLTHGVCTLRVHNTWMLQHIYGAIQEYGGFDEPAWLR
jgi:hypothetical protein